MLAPTLLLGAVLSIGSPLRLFDTAISFSAGDYPDHRYLRGLALDDLDGDGDLDAVMARRGGFFGAPIGLTLLENIGAGDYAEPIYIDVPGTGASDGFSQFVMADFDGDGDRDVAVSRPGAWYSEGSVSIFLKEPGFAYQYIGDAQTGGAGSYGIEAADFDDDGDVDLAVALPGGGFDTDLGILFNDGAANFTVAPLIELSAVPNKLATGDLDGDGDTDIVIACRNATAKVLHNDGSGGFGAPVNYPIGGSSMFYCDVAIGDIDNDGDLDVVASRFASPTQPTFAVARNDGAGNLAPWQLRSAPPNFSASTLELVDVDEDGWLDLLLGCVDETVNGVWALSRNDGAGQLSGLGLEDRLFAGESVEGIACTDIDNDGDRDILVAAGSSMQLTVFRNPGDHDFRPGTSYNVEGAHSDIVSGDIDNDGDLDLITCSHIGAGQIYVHTNDGTGAMQRTQVLSPSAPAFVKLGDLNLDGWLDMAWVQNAPPYEGYISLNQGNGTFGTPQLHQIRCGGPGDCGLYDVNNDDILDYIVVNRLVPYAGFLSISLGNGDGTFQPDNLVQIDLLPRGLTGGDVNNDGNIDLIVTVWEQGTCCSDFVDVLIGNGDGTFQPRYPVQVDFDPWDVVTADFNGDGILDIATCNSGAASATGAQYFPETISVAIGLGDGAFAPRVDYPNAFSPNLLATQSLAAADADHDGDIDLLVANAGAHDVSFYENTGDGSFLPMIGYATVGAALEVLCVDVTGDGVNDLITTAYTSSPDGIERMTIIPGLMQLLIGDMNCDGLVSVGDIGPFVLALTDPIQYPIDFPDCNLAHGDVNQDGVVSVGDIGPFVALLTGS